MDYDYWLKLGRESEPRFLPEYLASFRWHAASKNGTAYRRALREGFETSRRHATRAERFDVMMHYVHYRATSIVYSFL